MVHRMARGGGRVALNKRLPLEPPHRVFAKGKKGGGLTIPRGKGIGIHKKKKGCYDVAHE